MLSASPEGYNRISMQKWSELGRGMEQKYCAQMLTQTQTAQLQSQPQHSGPATEPAKAKAFHSLPQPQAQAPATSTGFPGASLPQPRQDGTAKS